MTPGDVEELARVLAACITDAELRARLGAKAKELFNRRFDSGRYPDRMDAIATHPLRIWKPGPPKLAAHASKGRSVSRTGRFSSRHPETAPHSGSPSTIFRRLARASSHQRHISLLERCLAIAATIVQQSAFVTVPLVMTGELTGLNAADVTENPYNTGAVGLSYGYSRCRSPRRTNRADSSEKYPIGSVYGAGTGVSYLVGSSGCHYSQRRRIRLDHASCSLLPIRFNTNGAMKFSHSDLRLWLLGHCCLAL